jgi:biopolymer transport protein TolR
MSFSTQSNDDDVIGEINITPLVDVMLVLLVAFIVTAPLLDKAIPLRLPRTEASASAPEQPVAVSVDRDGKTYIDKQPIGLVSLDQAFADLHARRPDAQISLRGDEDTPYGQMAKVLAALEHAGIEKLTVVTQPGE